MEMIIGVFIFAVIVTTFVWVAYNISGAGETVCEQPTVPKSTQEEYHKYKPEDIIVLDVETTGINPRYNDILQCSIIDGTGNVLFNEYCRPSKRKKWDDAQAVNGISPDDVKDCLTFDDFSPMVCDIIHKHKLIVGWNVEFDLKFLDAKEALPDNVKYCDVMKIFKYAHPESRYRLVDAAELYEVSFNAHNSVEDCKATLGVIEGLQKEEAVFEVKIWE